MGDRTDFVNEHGDVLYEIDRKTAAVIWGGCSLYYTLPNQTNIYARSWWTQVGIHWHVFPSEADRLFICEAYYKSNDFASRMANFESIYNSLVLSYFGL